MANKSVRALAMLVNGNLAAVQRNKKSLENSLFNDQHEVWGEVTFVPCVVTYKLPPKRRGKKGK